MHRRVLGGEGHGGRAGDVRAHSKRGRVGGQPAPLLACAAEDNPSPTDDPPPPPHLRSRRYSISGVVPPDEFAQGSFFRGVSDNPYTNWVARQALLLAAELDPGAAGAGRWREVGGGLVLLFDEGAGTHPEYEGFPGGQSRNSGGAVKQADVALMYFPGDNHEVPADVVASDLEYYEGLYFEGGPAMTYSAHAVGWLEAGSRTAALRAFETSLLNRHTPWSVWTETRDPADHPSDMGCYNFLTGAGGVVQSVTGGYGGVRYREGGMRWRVRCGEEEGGVFGGRIEFRLVKYLGYALNVVGGGGEVLVELVGEPAGGDGGCRLAVEVDGQLEALQAGERWGEGRGMEDREFYLKRVC